MTHAEVYSKLECDRITKLAGTFKGMCNYLVTERYVSDEQRTELFKMIDRNVEHGDFFYYEKAPEQVRIMVNGMNLDGLAEVWKVTKDRRI